MTRKQLLAALTTAMHQAPDACHDTVERIVAELRIDDATGYSRDDDEPVPVPVPSGVVA